MLIITDSREKAPLSFSPTVGIKHETSCLPVGDYGCRFKDGTLCPAVIERKEIGDLFNSFSTGYTAEKNKILKAKELKWDYILAIEGTIFDVRGGYSYHESGETRWSKKNGMSQVRQIMTMYAKNYFHVWFCPDRQQMAFKIQEFFLAKERVYENSNGAQKTDKGSLTTGKSLVGKSASSKLRDEEKIDIKR